MALKKMGKPMNILITGGLGFIGSHTAAVFAGLGHHIILYDNLANSSSLILEKLMRITRKKIPFINADVRDTELLTSTLHSYQIDAVIHFAGLKAVGESTQIPIHYYANNIQGTISLLQAMQSAQIKTLVFSSSATIYGEPQYLPLDENHPTNPTNPYGRNKLFIEKMLNDLALSDKSWRIVCLRYFNPVGAHESRLIGENPNGEPNNLMPYIAQVAAGQRAELSIYGNNYPTKDGTGIRDYIHVMDLAEGHVAALGFLTQTAGWHAINLGTGSGFSVLDIVEEFQKVSGKQVPYKIVNRRIGDVAVCFANPKKASEVLKWTASRTLYEMCRSTWYFQQSQN